VSKKKKRKERRIQNRRAEEGSSWTSIIKQMCVSVNSHACQRGLNTVKLMLFYGWDQASTIEKLSPITHIV
jgi:hypothetical protein